MRIALKFAYDRKQFNGYARQPSLKTVEGKIIDLLTSHDFIEDAKESMFRSAVGQIKKFLLLEVLLHLRTFRYLFYRISSKIEIEIL